MTRSLTEDSNVTSTDRVTMSDQALRAAFRSLPNYTKYFELIDHYFENLKPDEDNYDLVKDCIRALWERVRKEADFLDYTLDFEPLLRELGLRDHFKHSLNVYVLGYTIINNLYRLGDGLQFFRTTPENTNLIWLLTSTFHDTAYAVEKTDQWLNDFFDKFLGINPQFSFRVSEVLTPVYSDFMRMLSEYHKSPSTPTFHFAFDTMDWYYYNELSKEFARKNHGVLSALMLCHRMAIKEGFLCKSPQRADNAVDRNQWDFLNHLTASHAISLHSIEAVPIRFEQHPFAFMLVLCDEMQDWGRGNVKNHDFVALEWVDVKIEEDVPQIRFKINCDTERMNSLLAALQKRLLSSTNVGPNIFVNGGKVL
jgi:hypothetical protein